MITSGGGANYADLHVNDQERGCGSVANGYHREL